MLWTQTLNGHLLEKIIHNLVHNYPNPIYAPILWQQSLRAARIQCGSGTSHMIKLLLRFVHSYYTVKLTVNFKSNSTINRYRKIQRWMPASEPTTLRLRVHRPSRLRISYRALTTKFSLSFTSKWRTSRWTQITQKHTKHGHTLCSAQSVCRYLNVRAKGVDGTVDCVGHSQCCAVYSGTNRTYQTGHECTPRRHYGKQR